MTKMVQPRHKLTPLVYFLFLVVGLFTLAGCNNKNNTVATDTTADQANQTASSNQLPGGLPTDNSGTDQVWTEEQSGPTETLDLAGIKNALNDLDQLDKVDINQLDSEVLSNDDIEQFK